MSFSSANTAKQYAYKLCSYLNYLHDIWKVDYIEAETKHLKNFIRYMQYGQNIIPFGTVEGNKSGFTIQSYVATIKRFYEFLYSQGIDLDLDFKEKRNINPEAYLYGQVWDIMIPKLEIDDSFDRSKPLVEYEKWYTEEQKEAIFDNFNTYRDKAIFSISLDGCRIDEILSIKMNNYNDIEGIITLYRSKGKITGETGRIVILSERSRAFIEEYLFNERANIEIKFFEEGKTLTDYMFVNLQETTDSYGEPVQYYNFYKILKNTAKRAGLDPSKIRTHSGRSTKAGELFRYQAEHPEQLTDDQIKTIMGWKSLESAEPYKNKQDKETTLLVAKKLTEIKKERGKNNH